MELEATMKKNLLSSNIALILASSSLLLSACGGSSDNSAESKAPNTDSELTETAHILCTDINNDGQCSTGEPSIASAVGAIPNAFRSEKYRTLLQLKEGGLLVAAPSSTEISVYSTIINNEIVFNPTITGDKLKAAEYLSNKNIPTQLSQQQTTQFYTSVATALAENTTRHPFKTIAAITDEIINTGQFNVAVNEDNIIAQAAAKRAVSFSEEFFSWELGDHDETPVASTVLEGRGLAVIATKYHNNILVIDTTTKTIKNKTAFAQVAGDRYAVDADSGASEKPFKDIQASNDAQSVYILVATKGDTSNAEAGIYRVAINDDGSAAAIDDDSTQFFANENIDRFSLLNNGEILVEDTSTDSLILLDANLNQLDSIDKVAGKYLDEISSLYPSPDGTTFFTVLAGSEDSPTTLNRINRENNTTTHSLEITKELDKLIFFNNDQQALAYSEDAYAIIINLSDLSIVKTLELSSAEIETATVSENGQFALIAGHDNKKLMIFDLSSFESSPVKAISVKDRIRALSISNNGLVMASGGHHDSFIYLDTPVIGAVLSPSELVSNDKSILTEEFINQGIDLSIVVSDLNMPTAIPSGFGSEINWLSSIAAINTTHTDEQDIGAVVRPTDNNISGSITANLSYSFRDLIETDTKVFDLTVRKAPQELVSTASIDTTSNYLYYIDTSPTGQTAVGVFSKAYTFNVLKRTTTSPTASEISYLLGNNIDEQQTHQSYPANYSETRPVGTRYLDENHIVIAMPEGKDGDTTIPGALLTYDITAENILSTDGFKSAAVISTLVSAGKIKALSHINNSRLAFIEELTAGDSTTRNAVIYTINGFNLENPIRFAIAEDASAIEVDSTGNNVFVISNQGVIKYTQGIEAATGSSIEFNPYVLAISDNHIYSATDDGKLYGFLQTDMSTSLVFNTAYGQRSRTLDIVNDNAFLSVNSVGLVAVTLDSSNANAIQAEEDKTFFHSRQRRAATSMDGNWAFAAQYISKSDNKIQLIKLN